MGGGGRVSCVDGLVLYWIALMGDAPFPLLCCTSRKNGQFGGLNGDVRESRVKVFEGEFPRISA